MIWNLVKADFLKVRGNRSLWLFIFGTTFLAGLTTFLMTGNSTRIIALYSIYLLLCFPLGVGILASFVCKVDEDNWALLYTKNHRFRYFISKTILLALLSFLSLTLVYVGFIPVVLELTQGKDQLISLGMIFLTYYCLLFFLFPLFISLYTFIRGSILPIFVILLFYFLYPAVGPMVSMSGNKVGDNFTRMDKVIYDYLPQNQFDKELIVKTFLKDGKVDPALNEGISFRYAKERDDFFNTFYQKGYQITHSLITGQSKSLYIGLAYFLLFGTIGYVGMRRREIKT